jgi:hypothetical protein
VWCKGKWSEQTVYLVSSHTLEELQAEGLLRLKRGYWVIESRLHHCLDVTLQEDLSRVRSPKAARVLGMIRRIIVSLANAAVDRARKVKPKTKCNTRSFNGCITTVFASITRPGIGHDYPHLFFLQLKNIGQFLLHAKRTLCAGPDGKLSINPLGHCCPCLQRYMSYIMDVIGLGVFEISFG